MAEEKKLFDRVAVTLTDAQVFELGKQQAEKKVAYDKLDAEKKAMDKTYNDKLNTLDAELSDIARKINNREDEREIEIVEEPDDGRKTMIVKEKATGRMLRTRKMTLEEIGDSEFRLNGGANGAAHDTEPPEGEEKPKRRGRKAAAEANEELGD